MGISMEWDRSGETCVFRVSGKQYLPDFKQAMEAFVARGTGRYSLWDLTEAEADHLTTSDLVELGRIRDRLAPKREKGKVAVVAPSDVAFGLARMLEGFSAKTDAPYKVFRDLDSARAWLGEIA